MFFFPLLPGRGVPLGALSGVRGVVHRRGHGNTGAARDAGRGAA